MSGLPTAKEAAADIWRSLSLPDSDLDHLMFTGEPDSAVNSSFRLGVAAQVSIGLAGLSSAKFNELRTSVGQIVEVEARHAVIAFHSEAWYTLNGGLPKGEVWDPIAGLYETKNGGFVRIHTNFPHHRSGILKALGIPEIPTPTKEDVQSALQQWEAVAFETAAAATGMCAAALRSFDGWGEHLQAKSLIGTMPVSLIKIGEAPKRQVVRDAKYALEGIRVLDLSRVLAGPVAGRTLAAHGAEVLLVTSPNLPSLPLLDIETSIGKRTTQLDLTTEDDHCRLVDLARGADVFLQAYRPRGLEKLGFGTEELASLRPGIISANLCAWGWDGPWKDRRGFDSLVQTATGFNDAERKAYQEFIGKSTDGLITPRPLPMQALDHAAGYFLALGINTALCRTITEGGSWEVRVSLAAVGHWIHSLGCLSPAEAFGVGKPLPPRVFPPVPEIQALSIQWRQPEECDGHGDMTTVRHAAILFKTPVREGPESAAPMGLNVHQPAWT